MLTIRIARRTVALLAAAILLAAAPAVLANDSLQQGLNYFKTGKYAEAAAEFQSLVDGSPGYDYGHFMLGLSFLQMGKTKNAEQSLLKAIELNGDKFEYHNGLARVYFQQKQYPKVIATLKTAEPLANDDAKKKQLYSVRGFSYAALEKWADSIDDLEKARKYDPNSTAILGNLGKAYYSLGHYDKAVPVFRQTLKLDANDAGTMMLLGESLINLGAEATSDSQKSSHYREALDVAEKNARIKPESYESHNLVGRAALGANDFNKAEQAFRKVLAQKSDYCYAMVNLGKTYIAQQRWGDAESILRDAASCAPRMAVIYESLGFALQKQKKLPEAIGAYEKALQIKPSQSVRSAIENCKQNIEIARHNEEIARQEQEQDAQAAKAQAEYEEALRKQREWEERRKKDD